MELLTSGSLHLVLRLASPSSVSTSSLPNLNYARRQTPTRPTVLHVLRGASFFPLHLLGYGSTVPRQSTSVASCFMRSGRTNPHFDTSTLFAAF